MPRRRRAQERKVLVDPKYKNENVAKFINGMTLKGKRSISEHIFYDAMDIIEQKLKNDPLEIFMKAIITLPHNLLLANLQQLILLVHY